MKKMWYKKGMMILLCLVLLLCGTGCRQVVKMVKGNDITKEYETKTESSESQKPVKMMDESLVVGKETNQKLEDIEELIDENFYFEDDEALKQEGIIRGYLDSLGDPYSVYYNSEEYASFIESAEGEYVGVGVQVSQNAESKVITVVKVFDGPAKEAGILAEDVITKVNGVDITTWEIDAVVDDIKGEEGTEVTITVYRASEGKELDFTMERQMVENPTVESKMLDNNIGYIQVSSFYEVTGVQFVQAIENLQENGMEGLIVDLRDNGGGLLDIAVMMLDYILPEGKIVYTEDKNGNVTSEFSSDDDNQFTLPLVVLVNEYSASASEIFAGAIKDYKQGVIVGQTTYGKGIVQRLFPLEDGSAIKLTIAKYFTPNGNDIHKIGIVPDVEVELDIEKYRESSGEEDNQLDAAVEEVLKMLGKSSSETQQEQTSVEE